MSIFENNTALPDGTADIAPFAPLRDTGMQSFISQGLPTTKTEKWKFTPLGKLKDMKFTPANQNINDDMMSIATDLVKHACPVDYKRIVIINGTWVTDLSESPDGASVTALSGDRFGSIATPEKMDTMPLLALNTAHTTGGVHIHLDDGGKDTIHVIYMTIGDGVSSHSRAFVTVGDKADLTIVESHLSSGTNILSTSVTEATIGENAVWHHSKIQNEDLTATHYSHVDCTVAQSGNYDNFVLHLGAKTARCESRTLLNDKKSNVNLNGAYITNDRQHHDSATFIGHMAPDCTSHELYKGVLDDRGSGVFQGKILVDQIAQRTDGYQMNRALLLSDRARVNTKPELEIYADDVLCSHGCTTGELDEEQLFYMISRGIHPKQAQALLIDAFVRETIDHIVDEQSSDAINGMITSKLNSMVAKGS